MKKIILESFSKKEKNNKDYQTLLKNCGFSPNLFYDLEKSALILEKSPIKKIKSANDIKLFQKKEENIRLKKVYEAEDKDLFNKNNNELKNNIYLNYNFSSNNVFTSLTTLSSQDCLNKNIFEIYNPKTNYAIKAYKSKHKKKYSKFYEINSLALQEKNKYKLYHKCCYPGCERTFSSSGWLKAHLKEHLKQIHNSKYCQLFEKYILSEKIKFINKKNNFYYNDTLNKSNLNFENNCNNNINTDINNVFPFFTGINIPRPASTFFENDNIFKGEQNYFSLYQLYHC